MKKLVVILSVVLSIGLSACGSNSATKEPIKETDTKSTEVVSEETSENNIDTENNENAVLNDIIFKITRENEDVIIDNCIQSVDIISNNTIQIKINEDKISSFVQILDIFSEQTIKLYVNDTWITNLEVDDSVRSGILTIPNLTNDEVQTLANQLKLSIQNNEQNTEEISLEERLYKVAVEAIGSDDRIQNIAYDATTVKYLLTAGNEDEALLIEFSILYKMREAFDNMEVKFVFYTEEGNPSSAIRKSSYSADVRKNMNLEEMKDYHDLINYAE
ncbi:MAG: hypothetical protein IKY23_13505 [Lachnospiraceae bacterium]|nr:hypothetical protein [Lachnospiraceae bacterium]